ncbi:MAG: lamin tail domain-containing protein [Clostridia bacterium]
MKKMFKIKIIASFMLVATMLASLCGCSELMLNADSSHELFINEIVLSNTRCLVDEAYGTPDWIELFNASPSSVCLDGYGLSDDIKEPHKWEFPNVTIEPGGYLVIYATKSEDKNALCTGFGLSKNGETLLLTDRYYNVLQQLSAPHLSADISYARMLNGEYGYCVSPTPGDINDTAIASDLSQLAYASGDEQLVISEVMPKNSATLAAADGKYYSWVELYNQSADTILLSSYHLSDDPDDALKWRLPDVPLESGGYAVVFLSGLKNSGGEMHAPFKLGRDDDGICLTDSSGRITMMLAWDYEIPYDVSLLSNTCYTAFPTPGAANSDAYVESAVISSMTNDDPLRLNEALIHNTCGISDDDGDRESWVELYNSSSQPISLDDYCLSDDPENPFKWALPAFELGPDEYTVVFTSGKNRTSGPYHTSFTLSATDGTIILSDKNTLRVDALIFDPTIPDNVSVAPDGAGSIHYHTTPTPGAKNSKRSVTSASKAKLTNMNGIYISEVCATTATGNKTPDWIELHNASGDTADLTGWYISDDPDVPLKYQIPSLSIPSGGYAIIEATTAVNRKKGVTAPFGISTDGESLLLCDNNDEIIDAFSTGLLKYGITSGRLENDDTASRVYFTTSTRGSANTGKSYSSRTITPVFSENELYQTAPIQVKINCATPDAEIYYTVDGSKPTTASMRYTEPVKISTNTPLRALAYKDDMLPSDVATATYLFDERHSVPVVCLCADSNDFSAVYSVIDRWKKIEREGYFEFYESDGTLGTSFPCGLRVNGAGTLTYSQKSLAVLLRGGYGAASTQYQFFPGNDVNEYKSLVLRNSGQDFSKARLRDTYFSRAVEGLNIENVESRLTVVYINGKYWGLYDLNENQNENFLEMHYGIDPNAVDIIRRNETPLEGDRYDFKRVRAYALNTDLSDDNKFEKLAEWIDVDYFTDYIIAQSYFINSDMFNQKYWRSQDGSVKWRPVFYDLDFGFSGSSPSRSMLHNYFMAAGVPSVDESLTNMDIFVGLRKNAAWCDKFCERYVYVVINQFDPKRMTSILDDLSSQMKPEMKRHIARWGRPASVSSWEDAVLQLRKCIQERPDYALKYLQREFSISDAKMQIYIDKASQ